MFARTIHTISNRRGDMVSVNVAGLDDSVFSDTLFGHVRGAFTGAEKERGGLIAKARNGSLFLDEIGDLRPESQVKLLRLIQECEYFPLGCDEPRKTNARIIVSTNKDLWNLHKAGKFRDDLIYRLATHQIRIPPLRERIGDIPLLVDHFLKEGARAIKRNKPTPPRELYTLLKSHPFYGNIRELQAMIFNAVSCHKSDMVFLDTIKEQIFTGKKNSPIETDSDFGKAPLVTFSKVLPTLKQTTEYVITEAMKRSGGNITFAAEMLGITRQALSRRLNRSNNPSKKVS